MIILLTGLDNDNYFDKLAIRAGEVRDGIADPVDHLMCLQNIPPCI